MRITKKKAVSAVAVSAVVALGAGSAFAYWTTTGGGSGSAGVGTTALVTVVQSATPSGMGPGGPAKPLFGTFTNLDEFPVSITGLSAVVASTNKVDCAASNFAITGTAVLPTDGIIAVNDTSTWSGLNVSMTETGADQNACKDATLTITYTVT